MQKLILSILLAFLVIGRDYPTYKQCDPRWANTMIGTSSQTICQAGCQISSVAMALSGIGKIYNPSTMNQWLKSNGGYINGNILVWTSINKLGLTFVGFVVNQDIKSNLDKQNVVVLNVRNGSHWVLAYGYYGDSIMVKDSLYGSDSYRLIDVVQNKTAVYQLQ